MTKEIKSERAVQGGGVLERTLVDLNGGYLDPATGDRVTHQIEERSATATSNKPVSVPIWQMVSPEGAAYWGVHHRKIDTLVTRLLKMVVAGGSAVEGCVALGLFLLLITERYKLPVQDQQENARKIFAANAEDYPLLIQYLGTGPRFAHSGFAVRPDNLDKLLMMLLQVYQDYVQGEEAVVGTGIIEFLIFSSPTLCPPEGFSEVLRIADNYRRETLLNNPDCPAVPTCERFVKTFWKDLGVRMERVELKQSVVTQHSPISVTEAEHRMFFEATET